MIMLVPYLFAENNINILGSILNTKEDLNLESNGNINILNVKDSEYKYYYHQSLKKDLGAIAISTAAAAASSGGLRTSQGFKEGMNARKGSTYSNERYDETIIGSLITSGNDININSKKNTLIVSSNVASLNNINISTKDGNILIGTDKEQHTNNTIYQKHKINYLGTALNSAINNSLLTQAGKAANKVAGNSKITKNIANMLFMVPTAMSNLSDSIANSLYTDSKEIYTKDTSNINISSSLGTLNDINLISDDNITINASNLNTVKGDMNIKANNNVNIISGTNTEIKTVVTKDDSNKLNSLKDIDIVHTNSSVGVGVSYDITKTNRTTKTSKETESNLTSNDGNINIVSKNKDINIVSSNIVAKESVNLESNNGGINITSKEETTEVKDRTEIDTINMNASVSNTWLKLADDAYNMSKNYDDTKEGNTNLLLNTLTDVTSAVSSAGTFGFTVGVGVNYNKTEIDYNSKETNNKQSNIASINNDINITTENDINIKGTNLLTNNDINIISNDGDIKIENTQNKKKQETNVKSKSAGISVNADIHDNIGNTASSFMDTSLNLNLGYGKSKETKETIKNDELYIKGDNINITTNNKDKSVILTGLDKETENNLNIINNNNIQKNELKEKNEEENETININISIDPKNNITNNLLSTTLSYKNSDGYDFVANPKTFLTITKAIEDYTGHKLTWRIGGDAVYKKKADKETNSSTYDSVDPKNTNIGKANYADEGSENLTRKEYLEKYNFLDLNVKNYVGDTVDKADSLANEGSLFMKFVSLIPGMNSMSVMHDKWTDDIKGIGNGALSNTPNLESSIIPAIPITYLGLIFGGTLNDLNINYDYDKIKSPNETTNNINNNINNNVDTNTSIIFNNNQNTNNYTQELIKKLMEIKNGTNN